MTLSSFWNVPQKLIPPFARSRECAINSINGQDENKDTLSSPPLPPKRGPRIVRPDKEKFQSIIYVGSLSDAPRNCPDNVAAVDLALTPDEVTRVGNAAKAEAISGTRYPEQQLGGLGI